MMSIVAPGAACTNSRSCSTPRTNKTTTATKSNHSNNTDTNNAAGIRSLDVLFGRTQEAVHHLGTVSFRQMIQDEYLPRYDKNVPRRVKASIVYEIMNRIHRMGGRFLRFSKDDPTNNRWVEIEEESTRKTITQTLRDVRNASLTPGTDDADNNRGKRKKKGSKKLGLKNHHSSEITSKRKKEADFLSPSEVSSSFEKSSSLIGEGGGDVTPTIVFPAWKQTATTTTTTTIANDGLPQAVHSNNNEYKMDFSAVTPFCHHSYYYPDHATTTTTTTTTTDDITLENCLQDCSFSITTTNNNNNNNHHDETSSQCSCCGCHLQEHEISAFGEEEEETTPSKEMMMNSHIGSENDDFFEDDDDLSCLELLGNLEQAIYMTHPLMSHDDSVMTESDADDDTSVFSW